MGRLLFTCHDAGGTVPPVLAVARALGERGHDVTILSQPSVRERATALGCGFVAFSETADYLRDVALEEQLDRTLPVLVGASVGADLIAVAHETAADVLVLDPNLSGALAAAEALESRSVVLLHSLFKTFVDVWFGELWPLLGESINSTRRSFGAADAYSWADTLTRHDLVVSPVPESFDAPVENRPENMRHVGFLVPHAPTKIALDITRRDKPVVAVSFSTTCQQQDDLITATLAALSNEPLRVVVTTSGYGTQSEVPANAVVEDFVPHPALFAHADVVVTHGGLGTTAAALQKGVPLVCIPGGRDQPLNAARVSALGAGVTTSAHFGPETLRNCVRDVLSNSTYRTAAGEIATASRQAGEAQAAASAIEELLP